MELLELDRTHGQEYWIMDLNYYSGEVDPKGFAENMASNCNGNENNHPAQEKTVDDEEAPPSYAVAFPPLPKAPNEIGRTAAPSVKWGKSESKSYAKPTPKAVLTNITQVSRDSNNSCVSFPRFFTTAKEVFFSQYFVFYFTCLNKWKQVVVLSDNCRFLP